MLIEIATYPFLYLHQFLSSDIGSVCKVTYYGQSKLFQMRVCLDDGLEIRYDSMQCRLFLPSLIDTAQIKQRRQNVRLEIGVLRSWTAGKQWDQGGNDMEVLQVRQSLRF